MILTQSVGEEIKNYLVRLLGKEALIVNSEGICISSPNTREIGKKVDLPNDVYDASNVTSVEIGGVNQLVIPLEYDNERVAVLVLNEEREKIKDYLPLIKSFAELLISQYYENHKPILDSTDQFITKLLNNATPNEFPYYESEAKVLGYDLTVDRLAITVHLDGFWEKYLLSVDQPSFERDEVIKTAKKKIEDVVNGFFSRNNDIIIAYLGSDKFVIFKAVTHFDEDDIKKFLKKSYKAIFEPLKNYRIRNIAVGFGNPYSGVSGLVTAYKEADLSLELGRKLWGSEKSYYFGDLGLLTILGEGNREKNIQFADSLLRKMKNDDLSKTLEAFFDNNLNLTETAEQMGVHRNTVIYRLNQISKILGADPRIFEQAMSIKLALLIKRLFY